MMERIHLECPRCKKKDERGSLVFVGVKDGLNYYKCCMCDYETNVVENE